MDMCPIFLLTFKNKILLRGEMLHIVLQHVDLSEYIRVGLGPFFVFDLSLVFPVSYLATYFAQLYFLLSLHFY